MRHLLTALALVGLLAFPVLPFPIGCHRVAGHHHGHGKPSVVCFGG